MYTYIYISASLSGQPSSVTDFFLRSSFEFLEPQLLNSDTFISTHHLTNISFSAILDMLLSTSSFPYLASSILAKFPPCSDIFFSD